VGSRRTPGAATRRGLLELSSDSREVDVACSTSMLMSCTITRSATSSQAGRGTRACEPTRATRLIMEVLNYSGDDADEDRKLDIVPKYMHLRRDLNTVSISQRLQQTAQAAHSDFNGPGVID
jgi:hypothetical protein